jgi:MFS family permease
VNSRRSWLVFGAAVLVYVVAVTQRTSFGVAGVDATARFDVNAASLSSVAVVQIIVYAALQIPVGVLADRFGPRVLLIGGAALMALGQLLLAFSDVLGLAIVARILVGAGDAFTFISAIRLLPYWFKGRIVPLLTQGLGMTGQLGQILSAFPFAFLLHSAGWQPAFLALSGVSLVAIGVAVFFVRVREVVVTSPIGVDDVRSRLRASLARPGTQLGFWAHMLAGTAPNLMATLWGYPFLTAGLGYPPAMAGGIFVLLVLGNVLSAPLIGLLVARYPLRRSNVVLTVVTITYAIWALLLVWPGTPPVALVAALFLAIGAGGPGSLVGFDFARSFNPSHALGSASGIVNVGGFLGGFVSMFGIGIVLDVLDRSHVAAGAASDLYSFDSFRLAFFVPFVIVVVALFGMLHARHRTRRRLFEEEGIAVSPLWVALFRRWRRRRPPVAPRVVGE